MNDALDFEIWDVKREVMYTPAQIIAIYPRSGSIVIGPGRDSDKFEIDLLLKEYKIRQFVAGAGRYKIYESDLVRIGFNEGAVALCVVKYDSESASYIFENKQGDYWAFNDSCIAATAVIGNIYQNPGLLDV